MRNDTKKNKSNQISMFIQLNCLETCIVSEMSPINR
jgi:hypothetical protein